jgi:3-oxoacyl-[acyl-carrier protein] reductase
MPGKLEGKTCIVTGPSKGLGRSFAVKMAAEGCDVVVNYNKEAELAKDTAAEIKKLNRKALLIKADVSRKADVDLLAQKTLDAYSKADVLINNAGIFIAKLSLELTEEEWDKTIDTNLKGVFFCSQIIGRGMVERRSGAIVNISSVAAFFIVSRSRCLLRGESRSRASNQDSGDRLESL